MNSLSTWNVRGTNGIAKRKEALDVFRKGKRIACMGCDEDEEAQDDHMV